MEGYHVLVTTASDLFVIQNFTVAFRGMAI